MTAVAATVPGDEQTTGPSGPADRPSSSSPDPEHEAALLRAYELQALIQIQDCRAVMADHLATARDRRWADVEAVVHYARFSESNDADQNCPEVVADLLDAAQRSGDDALVALGLAARALRGDPAQRPAGTSPEQDVARAVALLGDQGHGSPHAPIAYNACSLWYDRLGLWELTLEMYDGAAAAIAAAAPGVPSAIAGLKRLVITVNRLDTETVLACMLTELGRRDEAAELALRRPALTEQDLRELPEQWVTEAQATAHLLAAVAREPRAADGAAQVQELLARLLPDKRSGYRAFVYLAEAIRAHDDGDPVAAAAHAESGLLQVVEDVAAGVKPLLLYLATSADPDAPAWQRYAREITQMRWDARMLVLETAHAQIAVERAMLDNERLSRRAYVDELTGLANRHAYARHLSRLRSADPGDGLTVMMVDVDHFKAVNDTFGHAVGDHVLAVLGARMLAVTRPSDLAVRLGGDEFLILLAAGASLDVRERGQALIQAVRDHPWDEVADGLRVHLSIGAASGRACEIDALVAEADRRLYAAKSAGRDRVVDS